MYMPLRQNNVNVDMEAYVKDACLQSTQKLFDPLL